MCMMRRKTHLADKKMAQRMRTKLDTLMTN